RAARSSRGTGATRRSSACSPSPGTAGRSPANPRESRKRSPRSPRRRRRRSRSMADRWGSAHAERPPFLVTFRWYVGLWKPLRWVLVRLVFLTLVSAALRVLLPSLFEPVIDRARASGHVPVGLAVAILAVG